MADRKIIWVLVSTNSNSQAEKIGRAVLAKRLCACFGIYPRIKSAYFWPPRSHRMETNKGPLLVLETLTKNYQPIVKAVRRLHSDKVPFMGKFQLTGVQQDFFNWMENEIK